MSPPAEVSDILNASRRLNSPALSESLKKKRSEREREKKGPKLAIIELVLFCGRKRFRALLGEAGPDKKTMMGATELREEPGGAVNADYCVPAAKAKGNPSQEEKKELLFSLPLGASSSLRSDNA